MRHATIPVLIVLLAACGPGAGSHLVTDLVDADGSAAGNPWLGLYRGNGQGAIAGVSVMPEEVLLVIQPDADSVRLETCAGCVTVRLDTLFVQTNVPPTSLVSLDLGYADGSVVRSLRLDRYSASGGIGNVINANLTLSGDVVGAIEYVLERR
ncbi:MAG: hypothetical protein ACPHQP_01580 [Longimicrobiales bacterium]